MTPGLQLVDRCAAECGRAVRAASRAILERQTPEGYWWEYLTADTTLESDYILLELWMHPPCNGIWDPPRRDRIERAARSIAARQLADGGFNIYPDGPADVSASVKAYFALKLVDLPECRGALDRARTAILNLGGIQAANSYVKLNLSLFGLYPREFTPSVPPELVLLGDLVYEMSSWTRAIVIPLAVVHAANPNRPVPQGFDLAELFLPGASLEIPNDRGYFSWRNFFLTADQLLKFWEHCDFTIGLRKKALKKAEQWIVDHHRNSDGLGAIYPAMQYAIMALDVLGYAPDHPVRAEAVAQFERLLVDDGRNFFFQPCFSPVWDTAIAAHALGEAGESGAAMERCGDWLLTKEVREKGDWSRKRPKLEPSGWYFEFANEHYPDIDDTAMVLLALEYARARDRSAHEQTVRRAVNWLLGMQGANGGWAAFDVNNDWEFLGDIPFADHNAMLDPSCPDITGRVLEALCRNGVDRNSQPVRRAVDYLLREQEGDGSWFGRWGVAYIYGTFLALRGLRAAGLDDREPEILRAGEWLRSIQNADGGWGESCGSYDRGTFVAAASTASQTAWALLGLMASGDTDSLSVRKGIEYLVETQRADGTWDEHLGTGTGFPKVFYLTYHSYRNSFPLLALATYLKRGPDRRGELASSPR